MSVVIPLILLSKFSFLEIKKSQASQVATVDGKSWRLIPIYEIKHG